MILYQFFLTTLKVIFFGILNNECGVTNVKLWQNGQNAPNFYLKEKASKN